MRALTYILIFSAALADCYLFLPYLRSETLSAIALIIYCSLIKKNNKEEKEIDSHNIAKRKLINSALLFIGYIVIIDFFRMQIGPSIGTVIGELIILSFFYYFENVDNNIKIIYVYIVFFVFYNSLFAFDQLLGGDLTVGKILSFTNLIGVERLYMGDTGQGTRISGGYSYCITLNIFLGCIVSFLFFLRSYKKPYINIIMLVLVLFFQYETMTRSALFSMPIAIILGYLSCNVKNAKNLLIRGAVISVVIYVAWLIIAPHVNADEGSRRTEFRDGSSINRYQVNIYACVGTFYKSPIIGIPNDELIAYNTIMDGYSRIGLILQDTFEPIVTHHNEPAYYFRYYGFVGLFLYFSLYYHIFRFIFASNKSPKIKQALITIVFYFFFYNLMHNAKIINSFPVWLFLSLNGTINTEDNRFLKIEK